MERLAGHRLRLIPTERFKGTENARAIGGQSLSFGGSAKGNRANYPSTFPFLNELVFETYLPLDTDTNTIERQRKTTDFKRYVDEVNAILGGGKLQHAQPVDVAGSMKKLSSSGGIDDDDDQGVVTGPLESTTEKRRRMRQELVGGCIGPRTMPRYLGLGEICAHHEMLKSCSLNPKYRGMAPIQSLPSQMVSPDFHDVLVEFLQSERFNRKEYDRLHGEQKVLLRKLLDKAD